MGLRVLNNKPTDKFDRQLRHNIWFLEKSSRKLTIFKRKINPDHFVWVKACSAVYGAATSVETLTSCWLFWAAQTPSASSPAMLEQVNNLQNHS